MHTPARLTQGLRPFFTVGRTVRGARFAVALAIALLLGPLPAAAQVGFPGAPDQSGFNLRVYPTDVWGPRVGPGIGLGLVGHNLARRHDQWLLTAAPARYEQVGTLSFASANPRRARQTVLVDTRALHTTRDWIGPWSLRRSALRGRLRVGQSALDHRLLVQPHLSVQHQNVIDVHRRRGGIGDDPEMRPPPQQRNRTGLRTGLDVRFDTRPRPPLSNRGVLLQGTWDRYVPLDGSALRYDQWVLDAYGFVPLAGLHRLAVRTSLTLTRARSDVPVPLYSLPTLGGTVVPGWSRGQFVGSDRLLGSLLYRFPLWEMGDLVRLEGHLGTHAATVYANVGDQFTAAVQFGDERADGPDRPLRPAASAGLRIVVPFRDRTTVDLALGVSPDGWSAVRFTFTRPLQSIRSAHHTSDPIR